MHLSTNENTAIQVGKRKTGLKEEPVIIAVSAIEAYDSGAHFYQGTDSVWLADYIHPYFMRLLAINSRYNIMTRTYAVCKRCGSAYCSRHIDQVKNAYYCKDHR